MKFNYFRFSCDLTKFLFSKSFVALLILSVTLSFTTRAVAQNKCAHLYTKFDTEFKFDINEAEERLGGRFYKDPVEPIFYFEPRGRHDHIMFVSLHEMNKPSEPTSKAELFIKLIGRYSSIYKTESQFTRQGIGTELIAMVIDHYLKQGKEISFSAELAWHNGWAIESAAYASLVYGKVFSTPKDFDHYRKLHPQNKNDASLFMLRTEDIRSRVGIENEMRKAIRFSPLARIMAKFGFTQIDDIKIEWINQHSTSYVAPQITNVRFSRP